MYRIECDYASMARDGLYVSAARELGLPGVQCPRCGEQWASVASEYPSVSRSSLRSLSGQLVARNVPVDEYDRILARVRRIVGDELELRPGSQFGALQGKVSGKPAEIAWRLSWTLLLRADALAEARTWGVSVNAYAALLKWRRSRPPRYLEVEARPSIDAHPSCLPRRGREPCGRCGRSGLSRPKRLVLDRRGVDPSQFVQRVRNFRTVLVMQPRIVERIRARGWKHLKFEELELR